MSSSFVITIEAGDLPVMTLAGDVCQGCASGIREAFDELCRIGAAEAVLDCSLVNQVDSHCVATIICCIKRLKDAGCSVILAAATQRFIDLLEASGTVDLIETSDCAIGKEPCGSWREFGGKPLLVQFRTPLCASQSATIRGRVAQVAETMPFTSEQIEDIRLAVGEAVANAVRHGCKDVSNGVLDARCVGSDIRLAISLNYPGLPFDPKGVPEPDPSDLREGGIGIFLMRQAMDEVDYRFDETGTTITLVKYTSPDGRANEFGSNMER